MATNVKRQVKIKTGIVRRIKKELVMYKQEKESNDRRVDEMRENNLDEFDVRQAVRVRHRIRALSVHRVARNDDC